MAFADKCAREHDRLDALEDRDVAFRQVRRRRGLGDLFAYQQPQLSA